MRRLRFTTRFSLLGSSLWVVAASPWLHAQSFNASAQEALEKMNLSAGGTVQVTQSPVTGLATFVAAPPGKTIQTFAKRSALPAERGLDFLETYGSAFGISARN